MSAAGSVFRSPDGQTTVTITLAADGASAECLYRDVIGAELGTEISTRSPDEQGSWFASFGWERIPDDTPPAA